MKIKGMGVSEGIVKGRIRLIPVNTMDAEFDEGDILVTKVTNPRMVMLMNKAGGIITDVGGMTSHAAIVSRELGIPCIVQARMDDKKATEALMEGQIIEMDGKTGEAYVDQ